VSEAGEKNKALVRRFVEARDKGDLETIDELLAPNYVDHSLLPDQEPGREGFIQSVAEEHAIFSNFHTNIEDQAAEGDKVITRLTVNRIHDRGEFLGVAPTGMEFKSTAIIIHRIVGGKVVEEWSESTGVAEAMRQRLEQERIERERVEQELKVARTIQQASLPEEMPQLEGWQISPLYQPAREVGGDFYDFFDLEDGRVGVAVGDATGKGMPAALAVSATSSMLRAVAQAFGSSSPGEVLARVNETLLARIPSNMFVTCFYCILDPESATLSYANAGHDLPYLWHDGEAEELRARGMPLGLMPGMHYEEKEIVLQKGDSALLYTDGLVEAHDPQREMFGFPKLQALVAKHGEEQALGDLLVEELYSFVGEGWEQEDDITLLTLRRAAASH
jgi:serine phosphatase RsbU (regulator of sigma subunit)/ketosteroid isomerase-like protein